MPGITTTGAALINVLSTQVPNPVDKCAASFLATAATHYIIVSLIFFLSTLPDDVVGRDSRISMISGIIYFGSREKQYVKMSLFSRLPGDSGTTNTDILFPMSSSGIGITMAFFISGWLHSTVSISQISILYPLLFIM
jgi:hypothetical protein